MPACRQCWAVTARLRSSDRIVVVWEILQEEVVETDETKPLSANVRWRIISCVAILFGGIILAVWGISQSFGLPSEATYHLTQIALRLGLVVTVLGLAFGRRWVNLKTTLSATAILSVGILLFVLWIGSQ